jgi:ATP-dependent Clp protease adaptor protein ClpS
MPNTHTIEKTQIAINTSIAEPPMYKVIYVNDDVTSFDFVITSLIEIFDYDVDGAADIAERVHDVGQCVVAILPYELAEQKTIEVLTLARLHGYPLVVKVDLHT